MKRIRLSSGGAENEADTVIKWRPGDWSSIEALAAPMSSRAVLPVFRE
jgi:hypothetical protein